MRIRTIETPELGNRSYVVDDGSRSVVIDPQRDVDRLDPMLDHDVDFVLETHIHNDYVTGGFELARRTGAAYGVNQADPVQFDRFGLVDNQVLRAGDLQVTVLATPGHTDTHLAYLVTDLSDPDAAPALFSGGSLLNGTVGRTDLVSAALTVPLAHSQWQSAQRLGTLDPATVLYPTHGFGSFCAVTLAAGGDLSTIGEQRLVNSALTNPDEAAFVRDLVASLSAYPSYYAQMAPLNLAGPLGPHLDATFAHLDPGELAARLTGAGCVVDLRPAADYAARHLSGSISIALGAQFATYVGWLTEWGQPLTVIGPRVSDLIEARRQLVRIGIEPDGWAWGELTDLAPVSVAGYPRVGWDGFRPQIDETILDVRRPEEYGAGHLAGAVNIPLHELSGRVDELPAARTWVYCQSGFRAGTAASILDRLGVEVVYVDADFNAAAGLGLTA